MSFQPLSASLSLASLQRTVASRWLALGLVAMGTQLSLIAQDVKTSSPVASSTESQTAGQDAARAADWPLPRGDAQSSGATTQTLADPLEVKWEFKADEAIETTPIVSGDLVFLSDVMGKLYAIGRSDGKEVWSHNYDTGFLASPAVQRDLLVIGDVEGNLYGIEAATGKQLWKQTTEGEVSGAAAFYKDTVLVTSQDGKLYCYDAKSGEPKWTYATDDQIRCAPTIAKDRTFLGGCDGGLHIVDLNTGKAIGEPLPLGGPTGSTPAVRGQNVYLPIMDGVVLAFDWQKPGEKWRYEDDERAQEYRSSASVAGDFVVVSSQNKQVDALSAKTGKLIWRHTLKRRADASPVIAGQDVWIAASDGRLLRLDLNNAGKVKWEYEIRGSFLSAPAIADGKLYIADDDGVVRCFGPTN